MEEGEGGEGPPGKGREREEKDRETGGRGKGEGRFAMGLGCPDSSRRQVGQRFGPAGAPLSCSACYDISCYTVPIACKRHASR
eukprot:3641624-Pyramimonas_sp.AAC.1